MELTQEELDAKIEEGKAGLLTKNTDLIKDMKKLKTAMSAFDGVDLEALKAASLEVDKLREEKLTDEERRNLAQEAATKKQNETMQTILDLTATNLKMKKDNAVVNALRDAGTINDGMGEAVTLLINQRVTISDVGDAMVGDKTVAEYVKAFAETDGKAFFVPRNSGGGGNGSGNAGGEDWGKYFKKGADYSLDKQSELERTNPELYQKLSA
jgi:hypothetical protein